MRITKVYTRTGDKGLTGLADGTRLPKNAPRIAAYGTVDELNSILGLVRTFISTGPTESRERVEEMLKQVQHDLFDLGADLATPAGVEGALRIAPEAVGQLEAWIDSLNEDLPPLREFILPGGGPVGSFLHQARTVCRRGERDVLSLMDQTPDIGWGSIRYLNRLSDFLFVLGRWAAAALGEPEHFWERGRSRS